MGVTAVTFRVTSVTFKEIVFTITFFYMKIKSAYEKKEKNGSGGFIWKRWLRF